MFLQIVKKVNNLGNEKPGTFSSIILKRVKKHLEFVIVTYLSF